MMTHATHTDHACIQSDAAPCLDSEHVTPFLSLSLFSPARLMRLSGSAGGRRRRERTGKEVADERWRDH